MSFVVIVGVSVALIVINKIRQSALHNPDNQGMQRSYSIARSLLVSAFWIYMIIVTPIVIRRVASVYDSVVLEPSRHEEVSADEIRAVQSTQELSLADFFLPPLPLSWSDKH